MTIVVNYTAKTNCTGFLSSRIFCPIFAFGLIIENYTNNYVWDLFKLKHNGFDIKNGSISTDIIFDMNNISKGDEIILIPKLVAFGDPKIFISNDFPKDFKITSILLRLSYFFPYLHDKIIYDTILPYYAQWNTVNSTTINIYFN
jgi:hypothetical protein